MYCVGSYPQHIPGHNLIIAQTEVLVNGFHSKVRCQYVRRQFVQYLTNFVTDKTIQWIIFCQLVFIEIFLLHIRIRVRKAAVLVSFFKSIL